MAIRFFCSKCRAPLEVDDANAGRPVLCYHCRTQNTAPAESDPALVGDNITVPPPEPLPPPKPAALGILALLVSLALLVALIGATHWISIHVRDPLVRTPGFLDLPAAKQMELFSQKMIELREKHKGAVLGSIVAWGLGALLALILGVIAAATRRGSSYGIAGLVITILILLFLLYSMHVASRPLQGQPPPATSQATK